MPFPPNYRQERSNRERAKQRAALDKQARRDEKSSARKPDAPEDGAPLPDTPEIPKDN